MQIASFIGPAYKGRSIAVDGQELVNFFLEQNQQTSKNIYNLLPTPGLKTMTTLQYPGGIRGMFVTAQERLLIVVGSQLIEVLIDFNTVVLGVLNTTSTGRVSFAEVITSTGSYVMLVDGGNGYVLTTETNAFVTVGGDYQPGTSIVSMNGFFIQNTNDSWYGGSRFIYSGQFDNANTWSSGLDYFTAEVSPDPILSIKTINSELWLVGSKTTEVWYFTGDSNALFARVNTGLINIGTAAADSVVTLNNQIAWVGSNVHGNGSIWLGSGYIPQQISTNAIEYIIGQMDDISDCIAFSYMQEAHNFLIFNFPKGNRTLCYDLTTQMWHERASYDSINGRNNYHKATACTLWRGRVYVGTYTGNKLYQWDLDTYEDDGRIIRRVRTCGHLHSERKRIRYHNFEIDMERGVGLLPVRADGAIVQVVGESLGTHESGFNYDIGLMHTNLTDANTVLHVIGEGDYDLESGIYTVDLPTGVVSVTVPAGGPWPLRFDYEYQEPDYYVDQVGTDPKVMLQWSDDGGFTWSNENWASAGRRGSRFARVIWNRLGYSRDRVFRATFTDPIKFVVIDARAEISVAER